MFQVEDAMVVAAGQGHLMAVKALLGHSKYIRPNLETTAVVETSSVHDVRTKMTALEAAARGGHLDVVEELLQAGACVNRGDVEEVDTG